MLKIPFKECINSQHCLQIYKISDQFLLAVSSKIHVPCLNLILSPSLYTLACFFPYLPTLTSAESLSAEKQASVKLFVSSCSALSLMLYNNLYSYDFRKRETPGKETIITTAFLFSICPYRDTIFVGDRN